MNKRDLVLSVLDPQAKPAGVPAAFFLHFDPIYHRGQGAIDKHLEFFHYTGMDFVKIQYETSFPHLDSIKRPEDWASMPFYDMDFYEGQLKVVEGLVKAAKAEAMVVLTLYSPFMLAGQTVGEVLLTRHIQEDPEAVRRGMQIITDSLMQFVKACVHAGLDGFYTSTQGGEAGRLSDPALFDACVRPYDLALMEEVNHSCEFNILHVCDYRLPYQSLAPFVDYPGQVVNTNLDLLDSRVSAQAVAGMFKRPFMGGLDRLGILANGRPEEVKTAAEAVLAAAPERFILGADCTVPANTPWDNLRTAIQTAHSFRK